MIGKGYSAPLGEKLQAILVSNSCLDAVGNCPPVQHALWTLAGLDQFSKDPARWDPLMKMLLNHPAWCVRRNVLRSMPRTVASAASIASACAVNDEHGQVRLQALLALGEIANKPADMPGMWTRFKTIDATADSAFNHAGIAETAARPCLPRYEASVAFPEGSTRVQGDRGPANPGPRHELKFERRREGFRVLPHGGLASGTLSDFDLQGNLVFSSSYDARKAAWSEATARGLRQPLYGYRFRGADGSSLIGSVALVSLH